MALFTLNDNKTNTLYAAIAFSATLVVYFFTLCPTVYVGDSGEFITNAATLGINHPTGYTVYTLLTRVMIMATSFWTAAYSVNAFSALCAALTIGCLYYICALFTERKEIALAMSLVFGFSYTFWSRTSTAEVYTLNILFIALATYFVLRWYFSQNTRDLVILAYVVGFGLSQHITGAVFAPFIGLLILLKQPRILLNLKLLVVLFAIAALGFSSYVYLPIRSLANPPIDWGNPETLQRIMGHFLPKTGDKLFGELQEGYFDSRMDWVLTQVFTKEFWYFGVLSVFGLFALGSKQWRLLVFFLTAAGANAVFTIIRKLPLHADFDAYFLPSYLIMTVLLCLAADWGWKFIASRWQAEHSFIRLPLHIALFAIPLLLLKLHYYESDRSNNWFGYDFGKNMLSTVPQNAILFSTGDEQTFLSWYFKYAEKEREDITVVDRNLIGAVWGGSHMFNRELNLPIMENEPPVVLARQIMTAMVGKRPIYFSPRLPWP
ncbi:MAG TPA: DUF2723 domain-containing protein, partial [Bacteroidota bacterium]